MKARDPGDAERSETTAKPRPPQVDGARGTGAAHPLMRLQARAGNRAVSRLVAQRARATGRGPAAGVQRLAEGGSGALAPPVAPTPADPKADPRFAAVAGTVDRAAKNLKKHPSGAAEAKKAQNAAQAPTDDKAGQAKAAQADQMAAAKPKGFDKAGFVAAVKQAIAKAAPKNLDEADKFATSGKADAVKGEVMGKVGQGKEASAQDVAAKTAQAPDPSVAKDKPVTPLPPQPAPQAPPVDGAKAMPGKAPAEQTDLRAGPAEVKSTMADAEVTDQHLAASNEPQMQQAAAAKQQAEAHAAQAPAQIRQKEAQVLQQAQAGAAAGTRGAVAAMTAAKTGATGQVGVQQNTAKATEEKERARISGEINKIYDKTKGEVETILTGLDAKVTQEFDRGEAEARRAFTAKHKADMDRYKDQRYSGPAGWARWTGDLFMSLPKEADQIFVQAKAMYEERMTAVISGVADLIGRELDAAKAKIATGRQAIKDYVATQPKELQKIATSVAGEVNGKFDQLESDVDAKQESLVEDLAQKYVEARGAVDEEIKAEQAKNQGLVDMAKNAVGESVKSILALKDLFMGLLAKAASAFNLILAKPVQFISNFMSAVKQGFMNFASNILDHLKKGLQGWLFGQLANAGIELPEKFDLMGILKMIASLLGLTWNGIKARIAEKDPFLGKVIDTIQSKIEIFVVLATKGVVGVWDWIKEKVGDLKQLVFDQIKSFIIEKIVKAGLTWVLGMLNPAGALIKIVQALISVVQWIMERGAEMGEFIGSIIDAVMDIARGGGGGVPAKIEAALGKAVPLVISFLAGLLGLGGISEKVKSIIEKGQKLVGKAVDWVVGKAMKLARPLINAMKKGAAWVKGKYEAGKAWVKGKWEAGKAYVKKKWEAAKGWVKGTASAAGEKVGAWIHGVIRAVRGEERVAADGESHTLEARGNSAGTGVVVTMASKKGPLRKKLEAIIAKLSEKGVPKGGTDAKELLRLALKKETELVASMAAFAAARKAETSNRMPVDEAKRTAKQKVDVALKAIAADITAGLNKRNSGLRYRLPNWITDVRKQLYIGMGSGWDAARKRVFVRDFPKIWDVMSRIARSYESARTRALGRHGRGEEAGKLAHAELKSFRDDKADELKRAKNADGTRVIDLAIVAEFRRTGNIYEDMVRQVKFWNVDHRVPLAAHWQAIGFNSDDDKRWKHATDDANLELIARDDNTGSGSEYNNRRYNYQRLLGKDFESGICKKEEL